MNYKRLGIWNLYFLVGPSWPAKCRDLVCMGREPFARFSVRLPPEEFVESVPIDSAIYIDLNREFNEDNVSLGHSDFN